MWIKRIHVPEQNQTSFFLVLECSSSKLRVHIQKASILFIYFPSFFRPSKALKITLCFILYFVFFCYLHLQSTYFYSVENISLISRHLGVSVMEKGFVLQTEIESMTFHLLGCSSFRLRVYIEKELPIFLLKRLLIRNFLRHEAVVFSSVWNT